MSIFGPTPSAEHFARVDAGVFARQTRPTPQTTYNPVTIGDFVQPPEMPDTVKSEGLNGKTCLYGFEYPDSAVADYDKSRGIERSEACDVRSWMAYRKLAIMQDRSREHGLVLSTRIARVSSKAGMTSSPGAYREDVVYFAHMVDRKLVALVCPPVERIMQLKQAMRIEGELRWIVLQCSLSLDPRT